MKLCEKIRGNQISSGKEHGSKAAELLIYPLLDHQSLFVFERGEFGTLFSAVLKPGTFHCRKRSPIFIALTTVPNPFNRIRIDTCRISTDREVNNIFNAFNLFNRHVFCFHFSV